MGCPSMTTVGTVSLPSATDRTKAAASGSSQMFTWWTERRCSHRTRRSRRQNIQPGRQYTVTLVSAGRGSAGSFTAASQPRSASLTNVATHGRPSSDFAPIFLVGDVIAPIGLALADGEMRHEVIGRCSMPVPLAARSEDSVA
jgi:hypothetical protein